jgi:hypothetical protein
MTTKVKVVVLDTFYLIFLLNIMKHNLVNIAYVLCTFLFSIVVAYVCDVFIDVT